MAKILKNPMAYGKSVWKGGIGNGAITGVSQGLLGMIGLHPFFARMGGGLISASVIKNNIDKRVILLESTKEAVYQLMAGE